jgi:hypothetical protein
LLVVMTCHVARAQDEACDPATEQCPCEQEWGCWELIYTTKGTVLGVKATLTYTEGAGEDDLDAGLVTVYSTERFATRNSLSVHFLGFASIGGGTAGNEGALGGSLDFGWRGFVTDKSGPFLRVGLSGLLIGHDAFYVSMLEPFQGRAGYQILDGDRVLELGMTHGFIPVGRFDPGREARRDLGRSKELGGYAAVHYSGFRVDASFMHVFDAEPGFDRDDVELARALFCNYQLAVTICADALFTRGEANVRGRERMTHSLYMGLTLGLSP